MLLWGGSGGGKGERERVKERKGGMEGNTFLRILSTMYITYMITYLGHVKHKAGNTTPQTERLSLFFSKRK